MYFLTVPVGWESGCSLAESSGSGYLIRLQSRCHLGVHPSQGWAVEVSAANQTLVAVHSLRYLQAAGQRQ